MLNNVSKGQLPKRKLIKAEPNLITSEQRYKSKIRKIQIENEKLKSRLAKMEKWFSKNVIENPIEVPEININDENRFNVLDIEDMDDDEQIIEVEESNREIETNIIQRGSNNFETLKNQIKQTNSNTKDYANLIDNNKNPKVKKIIKPPPIHIHDQSIQHTLSLVKGIQINKFEIKRVNNQKHSLFTENMEEYSKAKDIFNEVNTKYFSYTPKDNKPKTLVLKGLTEEENLTELKAEIENIEEIQILNITQLKTKRSLENKRNLPLYIIQFNPNTSLARIYNIKVLNYQRIQWEQLKKNSEIMQCRNCQRFNHTAANCKLEYRCVKCTGQHKPGECPVLEKIESSIIFCINCKKTGHPASFRGCPVYQQTLQKLKQKINEKRESGNKPRLIKSTPVNMDNGSYADVLRNKQNENLSVLELGSKIKEMDQTIQQQSKQIAQLLDIINKL